MLTTKQTIEWFQDDRFWCAFRPLAFGEERWNRRRKDVSDLVQMLQCDTPDGKILDLCCGPGRYSLELASRGFKVTAVDLSKSYLTELKQLSKESSLTASLEIIQDDMRCFRRSEFFNHAICVGLSFGYFQDRVEDSKVLSNLYDSLLDGGTLAIEVPTVNWAKELGSWYIVNTKDSTAFVEQDTINDVSVKSKYHFRDGSEVRTFDFFQHLYGEEEVVLLLQQAGFSGIQLFAGYDGSPLSAKSRRIVAVGRKQMS